MFVYQYRIWLLLFYVAGSLFFLITIESVFNGGFDFSLRVLALPLALLIFGVMWSSRKFFYSETKSVWKAWLLALGLYLFALLFSWPYVMAVNAASSSGEKIIYRGPIQRKWIRRGARGNTSYEIDVLDSSTSTLVTLDVSSQKYISLHEGEIYTAEFIRGGFGIPYRWRFGLFADKH